MPVRSQRRVAYRHLNQYVPLTDNQTGAWPEITGIDPDTAAVGDPDVTLHCYGTSFAEGAVVVFDGDDVPSTFVSEGEVTAVISPSTATEGSVLVCVRNLDDRETEDLSFTFTAAAAPDIPALFAVTPNAAYIGHPGLSVQALGNKFTSGSVAKADGAPKATTFMSGTSLRFDLPAADLVAGKTLNITVSNDGGPDSDFRPFYVTGAAPVQPVITSLSPASLTVGSADTPLTVTGSGFDPASVVVLDGTYMTTTFNNETQLVSTVPAALMSAAGTIVVAVNKQGVGLSNEVNLPVAAAAPAPSISLIDPDNVYIGHPDVGLTLIGTGFVSGSTVVSADGVPKGTTVLAPQMLIFNMPAADLGAAATINVNASNDGGVSNSNTVVLTVAGAAPVWPVITGSIPSSLVTGSPDTPLTVIGTGFDAECYVSLGSIQQPTTFVSDTELSTVIPTAMIIPPLVGVGVMKPSVGSSNQLEIPVGAAPTLPALTSLDPTTLPAGSMDWSLYVYGTGFLDGDVVYADDTALSTMFFGDTQLSASMLGSLMTAEKTIAITQRRGAETSPPLTFTVGPALVVPTITSVAPASVVVGSPNTTLTVNGTDFAADCTIRLNGTTRTTTFVSDTQLTAVIPASLMAAAGNISAYVRKPNCGDSNQVDIPVTAAVEEGTWTPIFDKSADFTASGASEPGWSQYTIVEVIQLAGLSATGGTKIRLTLNGGAQAAKSSAVWVGNGGANPEYNFTGDQVQLTAAGSTTITAPAGGSVVTDAIDFVKDAVNSLVMSWQFTDEDTLTDMKTIPISAMPAGSAFYYGPGALAGDLSKPGFNVENSQWRLVSKVEVFAPAVVKTARKKATKKATKRKR